MKDNGSENMILYRVLIGSDAPLGRLQYDYITTFLTFFTSSIHLFDCGHQEARFGRCAVSEDSDGFLRAIIHRIDAKRPGLTGIPPALASYFLPYFLYRAVSQHVHHHPGSHAEGIDEGLDIGENADFPTFDPAIGPAVSRS